MGRNAIYVFEFFELFQHESTQNWIDSYVADDIWK